MSASDFLDACHSVMENGRRQAGIGTLGEKTLHAVLKAYFDPDPAHHEIAAGPYVADIRNEQGFFEIQTRDFFRLAGKLKLFLQEAPVTVVYPIPALKWLSWVQEDGEITPRRKSPKQAGPWEILPELYQIKPFLRQKDLRFCAMLLELEEYRLQNGWGSNGKRGSTRFERLPVALLGEVWITKPEDYLFLIPNTLSEKFTAKDFQKAAKLSPRNAWRALNVLQEMGAVERAGEQGRAYLYQKTGE